MTIGVVMLVHTAFDRAEQVIRHWVAGGCPVVVHVDRAIDQETYTAFVAALSDMETVRFSKRYRCEWGMWGLIEGTKEAATKMLADFPFVSHVFLASGACLPLRPIAELHDYLAARPQINFIESATTADVPWTIGGLDLERFTLRFPFSWKKRRRLFDGYVRLQQLLRVKRKIPVGLVPHMGSQWWCLTRETLHAILHDPNRPVYDRYFRKVWIPDESYFQTLVRLHSTHIESRSLTLSKFDVHGKPHIFYDDHAEILRRSGCFVARKIWPQAETIYQNFPRSSDPALAHDEPQTVTVDRIFGSAIERRERGRPGLYMQSRYPNLANANGIAAVPFSVMQGFDDVFPDFTRWLTEQTGAQVHGHLYAKDKVHFADDGTVFCGGLSDSARLRDYNGQSFLTNLIWNTRNRHQCFMYGPADTQAIRWLLARDTHAQIWVISGAWSIPLFLSGRPAKEIRSQASRLQRREHRLIKVLRASDARARIRIYSLADFIENSQEVLQSVVDEIAGHKAQELTTLPDMANMSGLPAFLQELKNQGMHPFLPGDLPLEMRPKPKPSSSPKSYVINHHE